MQKYKAIFVPASLHSKVKIAAAKKKLSMIEFIENLIRDSKSKGRENGLWSA